MAVKVEITIKPAEKGSIFFILDFKDQDDVSIGVGSLKSIIWSLTDTQDNVINARSNINIPITKNPQEILLSGNDLAISNTTNEKGRILTVEYTYDTTEQGKVYNDVPAKYEYSFKIEDFKIIA